MNLKCVRRVLVTILVSTVVAGLPGTARPAYPGFNGKLVFTSTRDDGFGDVYTMNADGSALTRFGVDLTIDQSPAWSPDGTRIGRDNDEAAEEEFEGDLLA